MKAGALLAIDTRRSAYVALVILTLLWGTNWIAMKFALLHADPVVFNVQRTWIAVATMFILMAWQRSLRWPTAWWPIVVTGFFQVTVNFGSTTMALASGGAGRTSVLVFTMPFWTMLIAAVVLHERVRGIRWFAIAFALVGLVLVVEPWRWEGDIAAKFWAVLSGFGWGAGSVATKYYQRRYRLDAISFLGWQMLVGVLPLTPLPWLIDVETTRWSVEYGATLVWTAVVSSALGFILWNAVLRVLPAGTASLNTFAIPVIALISSMLVFGERLTASEWAGIASIGIGLAILTVQALADSRRERDRSPSSRPSRLDAA